jgi:hypothetical protein
MSHLKDKTYVLLLFFFFVCQNDFILPLSDDFTDIYKAIIDEKIVLFIMRV